MKTPPRVGLLVLFIAISTIATAQTSISKPSGTTIISSTGSSSNWARAGGDVFTVRNGSWSTYHNCVYYGFGSTIANVIDGHNQNGCSSGKSTLSFNPGVSNLSGGIAVFNGYTNYYWVGFGTYTSTVRLTITFTDTLGNPLTLVNTGSYVLYKITQNFRVKYQLESYSPFSGTYVGAINLYDYANTSDGASQICTSLTLDDKFYQETTTATATNAGPVCSGNNVLMTATGGATSTSYVWSQYGSSSSFPNSNSFNLSPTGTANVRMKVVATGNLGCKDSAVTVVRLLDTAVEINVKGNGINIADGNTTTSIADNTDMGTTAPAVPLTKSFKVYNLGNQALKLNSASSTSAAFAVSGISFPYNIAPHDSVTLNLVFTPPSAGLYTTTLSINNQDCNEGVYDFTVIGTGGTCDTFKEIDIRGKFQSITSGSSSTSLNNNTDMGNIVETATGTVTFKIHNTRTSNLTINGISFSGGNASLFSVSGLSFPATIAGGDSASFAVTCNPLTLGVKATTVVVSNNDCDEYSYTFGIKATDICNTLREINLQGNGISIASGSSSTAINNNTDFGSTIPGGTITNTFTIQNTGSAGLIVSSVSLTGADASQFSPGSISTPFTIAGGSSMTFNVNFNPSSAGSKNAGISVVSNDCDEGTYTYAIHGSASSVKVVSITKPSGTTITPASADTRAWAMNSGSYWTFRNSNWKTWSQCTYWGYHDTIAAVINGYNTSASCSGLSDLYYSSGSSSLSAGKLVYTGSTYYYFLNNGGGFTLSSVPVRLTLRVTDTLGNALPLVRSGSISLLKITANYRVSYFLEAQSPSNAWGVSSGVYMGAIDLFNVMNTDPGSIICTSINPDQFYQVTTVAAAYNFGPYCASSAARIKADGGSSYKWTGPSGFTAYRNDTSFYAYGFPQNSRFAVEVTGFLGCKDSTSTVVVIRDTGSHATVTGNGNPISNGSTGISTSNNTNIGAALVGNSTSKSFTVSNSGSTTLTINSMAITGAGASSFSFNGITLPKNLSVSANTSFNVTFTPASTGVKSATVVLYTNSCSDDTFTFAIEGSTVKCDSTNPPATAPGMHKSSIVQTSAGGWTCYCDSAGKLLLSLKLGGTGAVIADTAVSMKISTPLAIHYPKNTGFIKSDSGFVVWNRTWDVKPKTQPSSQVPVRYFFLQSMVDSINQALMNKGQVPLPTNDSIYFWKVTNTSLGSHPGVPGIFLPDIKLIRGGMGYTSDTTWKDGSFGSNLYAEIKVSSFSGGGGGGGSFGLTPLPFEFLDLTAVQLGRKVKLNWYVENSCDVDHFVLTRSRDGRHFETFSSLPAQPGMQQYLSADDADFHADGYYYYQVLQVNSGGGILRSKIAVLNFSQESQAQVAVWPNPAAGILNLSFNNPDRQTMQILVRDASGKTVAEWNSNAAWMQQNIGAWQNGFYLISVYDNQKKLQGTVKVFKN